MYQKPTLQRFGALRELTLVGTDANGDGGVLGSGYINGCNIFGCDRS